MRALPRLPEQTRFSSSRSQRFWGSHSTEVPYRYHAAIAEAVDLPLILFQLQPALGGVLFTTEILHQLITIPSVAAIKEASFDAMRFLQVKAALESASRKITFLTGNDNFICESFILGAEGALLGFSTLGTQEQVRMLKAIQRGDIDEARELGSRLQPLADVIFAPPVTDYRARTKEALKMLGFWITPRSVRHSCPFRRLSTKPFDRRCKMPDCCLPCTVEENFTILFQRARSLGVHDTVTSVPIS